MPNKRFTLDDGLPVSIYKRRGNRNLRLTVNHEGEVRVSIPAWAPYRTGLEFARSRRDWISSQRRPAALLRDGQPVGKAHHLHFRASPGATRASSRVSSGAVVVLHPPTMGHDDPSLQKAAREGSIRALKSQAERLLPQRLAELARTHGFEYSGVVIRRLRSRWGSCDQDRNISLSLFLMQLPWEYIDYVILHELVHTRVMRHGPDFWGVMVDLKPDAKELRKALRGYRPALDSPSAADVA